MLIAATASAAGCVAAVFLALALVGYGWGWAVASATTYAAAALTSIGTWTSLGRRRSALFLSLVGVVSVGAVLGSLNTEIVNGRPVSSWSQTARIANEVRQIDGYLRTLQRADALLVLDQTNARARLDEITKMRATAQDLSSSLAKREGASEDTSTAFASIARSADAAYRALDNLVSLLSQYDSRREAEIATQRDTLIAEALNAAAYSRQAAASVGVTVGVQE